MALDLGRAPDGFLGAKPFPGFGRADATAREAEAEEDAAAADAAVVEDDGSDLEVAFDSDLPLDGKAGLSNDGPPEADEAQTALERLQQELQEQEAEYYHEEQAFEDLLEVAEAAAREREAEDTSPANLDRVAKLLQEAEQREEQEEEERRLLEFERLADQAAELQRLADEAATPTEAAELREQAKRLADSAEAVELREQAKRLAEDPPAPAPAAEEAAADEPTVEVEEVEGNDVPDAEVPPDVQPVEDAGDQDAVPASPGEDNDAEPLQEDATGAAEVGKEEQELRQRYLELLEKAAGQREALQATLDEIKRLETQLGLAEDTAAAADGIDIQGLYRPAKRPKRSATPKPPVSAGDDALAAGAEPPGD